MPKALHYLGSGTARNELAIIAAMIDTRALDELMRAVARVLPNTPEDLERNLRAALAGVCQRLDLVTREELDVQEAVLARTREKLERLEQQVSVLERKLTPKQP